MTNTYLIEIIKAMQPKERQEMAVFLAAAQSNHGGNGKEMTRLYQLILEAAPEFSEVLLGKERVYGQIFQEKAVVHGKLEKLMTDLNKHLRNFMLTQRYLSEQNEDSQQIDWAAWLRERGLGERAQQVLKKLKTKEEKEKAESMERFHTSLLIAEEEHLWELTHNQAKGDLNIPSLIHYLDLYYYNYRVELANRYLLQQKATQLPEFDFLINRRDSYQTESTRLLISQRVFDLLRKPIPSSEEIQGLMHLIRSKEDGLSFQTRDHFYAYLRNFCTILINGGRLDFIPIIYEINKESLAQGYFFLYGKIPPNPFVNLVQTALRAKQFNWAKNFIEDFKGLIVGGDEDQFFYRLCMAQCHFAEGDFDKALELIPDGASNSHHHHMIRLLELKIYYELRSGLLEYKIDAFRKFIERTAPKTISANLRTMDFNFLKILLQLSQSPLKDKDRSLRLIKRIDEKKLLADRAWLLEKAKELG